MGWFSSSASKEAKRASQEQRQAEKDRQQRIKDGMAEIDRVFSGAPHLPGRGIDAVKGAQAVQQGQTYYTADGRQYETAPRNFAPTAPTALVPGGKLNINPRSFRGRGGSPFNPDTMRKIGGMVREGTPGITNGISNELRVGKTPEQLMQMEMDAQNSIMSNVRNMADRGELFSNVSRGFDDAFYNSRKQAYMDYATPQLEDQYKDQQESLTFALARNGVLNSSVAANKVGKLSQQYSLRRGEVADQAVDLERQTKAEIERARGDLIAGLNATADPGEAGRAALAASSRLTMAPSFSPLGELFSNTTAGLVENQDRQRYNTGGSSPSLFGRGNSSRVVGG